MNTTTITDALLRNITVQVVIPGLMLAVLLLVMMFVLHRAQRMADFNLANMLRGDNGKESPWRLCTLGAFAISSWALMTEVLNDRLTSDVWWAYLLTWSGAIVLLEAAKRWNGSLPFSKGATITEPTPSATNAPTETAT